MNPPIDFIKELASIGTGMQLLANLAIVFTLGVALIPLFIYKEAIVGKYVRPIERRIREVCKHSLERGYRGEEARKLRAELEAAKAKPQAMPA